MKNQDDQTRNYTDTKALYEYLSRKAGYWRNEQWCYYANLPYLIDREHREKYASVFSGPNKKKIARKIRTNLKKNRIKADISESGLVILKKHRHEKNISMNIFFDLSYEDAVRSFGEKAVADKCVQASKAIVLMDDACRKSLDYIVEVANHGC